MVATWNITLCIQLLELLELEFVKKLLLLLLLHQENVNSVAITASAAGHWLRLVHALCSSTLLTELILSFAIDTEQITDLQKHSKNLH